MARYLLTLAAAALAIMIAFVSVAEADPATPTGRPSLATSTPPTSESSTAGARSLGPVVPDAPDPHLVPPFPRDASGEVRFVCAGPRAAEVPPPLPVRPHPAFSRPPPAR